MMKCGMGATIIEYRNSRDIDIKFADGAIVYHKRYENFKKGKVSNPNFKKKAS